MPIVQTSEFSIHYREAGRGKQPLVFVHGNYASSRWWLPQLERTPSCLHAFAPDLRGCGGADGRTDSHPSGQRVFIRDLAEDLFEFINKLGLEDPILVGHSLGGLIAAEYALGHSRSVKALVLVDSGPPGGVPFAALAGPFMLPLRMGNRAAIRIALRQVGLPRSGTYGEELLADALSTHPDQYDAFTEAVARWNVVSSLPSLKIPTLLIWGEKDSVTPLRIAREYLELLENAEMVVIPGVGHSPQIENPDRFATILRAFLASRVPTLELVMTRRPSLRDRVTGIRRLIPQAE